MSDEKLDNVANDPFTQTNGMGNMEYVFGESLMLFGNQKYHGKKYRPFYGVGVVYRVVKGDKQDLIYIRFGCFPTVKTRLVVAYHNQARRQTLTLKRGQCCQVYGICRHFTTKYTDLKTHKEGLRLRLGLYAIGISAWYVPTMIDIRRLPTNEDLEEPTEKEQEIQQTFEEVLDDFLNGNGEE